ncbi:hypothetical protein SEA_BIG4_293 [Microbacterium phage Big4]|nr:hypothetical protein SEA_BIG4_293 [Microbacterium phage Big4]
MSNDKYTHDPAFPFLVVGDVTGIIKGKFPEKRIAEQFLDLYTPDVHTIVDTTPEPLIPADVRFLYWEDSHQFGNYARRMEDGRWQIDSGTMFVDDAALLEDIGEHYTIRHLDMREGVQKR